ncbi:MAG: hypothetical protein ACREGG_03955 [Candidatus Saccharimonadales bacterium]
MQETFESASPEVQESSEPPELLLEHKVLYHGSSASGIDEFNHAEETTVGSGVYFVDNPTDAAGYAKRRAKRSEQLSPVVYKVEIDKTRLANLSSPQKLQEVMEGFAQVLEQKKASLPPESPWFVASAIDKSLEAIQGGINVGQVKGVVASQGSLFTQYLESLGYDGLKTPEGGEGEDIGNHDTYLIFDPSKIKVISEYQG